MIMEWINVWIPQTGATVLALTSVALLSMKGRVRRWGYTVGLAGQPFWFWMCYNTEQWVLLGMSIIYTAIWINGFRNHFMHQDAPETAPDASQRLKEALSEALDYLESEPGLRGDLVGCAVPVASYHRWAALCSKNNIEGLPYTGKMDGRDCYSMDRDDSNDE
jgi:hypothetical protein